MLRERFNVCRRHDLVLRTGDKQMSYVRNLMSIFNTISDDSTDEKWIIQSRINWVSILTVLPYMVLLILGIALMINVHDVARYYTSEPPDIKPSLDVFRTQSILIFLGIIVVPSIVIGVALSHFYDNLEQPSLIDKSEDRPRGLFSILSGIVNFLTWHWSSIIVMSGGLFAILVVLGKTGILSKTVGTRFSFTNKSPTVFGLSTMYFIQLVMVMFVPILIMILTRLFCHNMILNKWLTPDTVDNGRTFQNGRAAATTHENQYLGTQAYSFLFTFKVTPTVTNPLSRDTIWLGQPNWDMIGMLFIEAIFGVFLISALVCCYELGAFLHAVYKACPDPKEQAFQDQQDVVEGIIIGIIITIAFIILFGIFRIGCTYYFNQDPVCVAPPAPPVVAAGGAPPAPGGAPPAPGGAPPAVAIPAVGGGDGGDDDGAMNIRANLGALARIRERRRILDAELATLNAAAPPDRVAIDNVTMRIRTNDIMRNELLARITALMAMHNTLLDDINA